MASSNRVRNLLTPLINENLINVSNLIYEKEANEIPCGNGKIDKINYSVLKFKASNIIAWLKFLWNGAKFINLCKSNTEKGIIYNYGYPDLKNIFFLLFAKLKGYKIVFDIVEDNRYYKKFNNKLNRVKTLSSVYFLRLSPHIANAIIAISSHLYKLSLSISKEKIPVYLIPITVDLDRFKKISYEIPKTFKIFYGGSFGEKDGLELLINAFDELNITFDNIELILTGRASVADTKKLFSYIEQSPWKAKISYRGFLDSDTYYEVLNQCHIFCMTRVSSKFANAGFPFKLGEFLSSGKAVIATNVGDVSKYLTHNKNALLINPDSIEELVYSITYLLENPDKIAALGQNARKVADLNFDSRILSKLLLQIFKEV